MHTLVNPPVRADSDPEFKSSLSSLPGSRKWACKSQKPWVIINPLQSIVSADFWVETLPMDFIRPFSICTSAFFSVLFKGSITVPFFRMVFFLSFDIFTALIPFLAYLQAVNKVSPSVTQLH